MYFRHADDIWRDYPQLVPAVSYARGIAAGGAVADRLRPFNAAAQARLAARSEGELPEVQAWRRVFSRMGFKPTQYRCASESLLRRFKREGALPALHPFVDLCNAISMAYAIPVAVFDVEKIAGFLEVRYASGDEIFRTFGGEAERPAAGEVVFVDAANLAHARRWTHRQSGWSAVGASTTSVLVVAEGVHETANVDVPRLIATLAEEVAAVWAGAPVTATLTSAAPSFVFNPP
jgi:DNA/RNA-binding domain of Phe-tRNA-synthetase-like protein